MAYKISRGRILSAECLPHYTSWKINVDVVFLMPLWKTWQQNDKRGMRVIMFSVSSAVLDFGPRYHVQEICDAIIVIESFAPVLVSFSRSRDPFIVTRDRIGGPKPSGAGTRRQQN